MIFNYYGKYEENTKISFQAAQIDDLKEICAYLRTDEKLLEKVRFEIFDTREGKQTADPNHSISRASARFNEMAIYRFWIHTDDPHFPHEITHLVAHTWTNPYRLETELDTWDNKKIKKTIEMVSTSFMQEGLAIAVDDIVFKRKLLEEGKHKFIDDWCKEQLNGFPFSLNQVVNLQGFGSFENKVVIPFSASFSKFLLKTFGLDKYKKSYVEMRETLSPTQNIRIIEKTYGLSEKELLIKWREAIQI